ncbi:MAG: hypothetical protein O2960_16330 [Verrucomicrobia bacterium]|nr:hypothetical protein [Verrucomicrobiota bacterium]
MKTTSFGIALIILSATSALQAQTLLKNNGVTDGAPSEVLPQNSILHVQFNNPYRVIENVERFIVSTVPEKLLPPDMQQLTQLEHPVLTVLGMQTVQAPLNEEQIAAMTGLGADRPITLTLYLGEPTKSFVLSIPVDNFERFEDFLKQGLKPDSFESASIGGKTFVRASLQHSPLRQLVLASSRDRVYISGSESLLLLLYPGAGDSHLADDPHMKRVFRAGSSNDLWLAFNPNILKPLMPQLELFKYLPLNMLISKREELLKSIPPQQRQMIETRLRLQIGVNSLEELADYAECVISATYEELFDSLVGGIKSFNGISLAVKLDNAFPQFSFFLHSDQLQSDKTTRAIPLDEVRQALSRIPGRHNHISITGQTPKIVPSSRFTSWLERVKAGIEAKKLNPVFVLALEKLHLNTLHPQPVSSRVPWTIETLTEVNSAPEIGDATSLQAYGESLSGMTGYPAHRTVTVTPRQGSDLLLESMRQKIDAFEKNDKLVKETFLPDQNQVQLINKVYRLNSRDLESGVKEQTWETAFVSRGGLFGFNQHEFISRRVFYSRNVGDFAVFHQASKNARWISNLKFLETPRKDQGLAKLLDRVPDGANHVSIHRVLNGLPYVVDFLANFEALLHRDADAYLTKARAIAGETSDPEELTHKLQALQFSPLVYSLNRDKESGDIYCLLPGGISYPRPAIAPHVVKLLQDFREQADDVGGLLSYTRVADGTFEGSIIQSTEALSKLIKSIGNSIQEQILSDPGHMMELKDQIWTGQDRDANRFEEIITRNPTWEALPMPRQSGGWGQVQINQNKAEAKPSVDIAPRDAGAPANLIDLSDYFNASVNESWHAGGIANNDLGAIPQGVQELAGVKFDIRGIIQLTGRGAEEQLSVQFPKEVTGIQINRSCERLHALHAVGWVESDGTKVGSLVIHYSDGESRELPIVYGKQVSDWWTPPNTPVVTDAQVAWKGSNSASANLQSTLQLYKTSWPNPRFDAKIETIDYVSSHSNSAPFLIAITVE